MKTGTQLANDHNAPKPDADGVLIAAVMFFVFILAMAGTHIGGLLQ